MFEKVAGIKEYNCLVRGTLRPEHVRIMKHQTFILMPPRQIPLVRVQLGKSVDCVGAQEQQQGGWLELISVRN